MIENWDCYKHDDNWVGRNRKLEQPLAMTLPFLICRQMASSMRETRRRTGTKTTSGHQSHFSAAKSNHYVRHTVRWPRKDGYRGSCCSTTFCVAVVASPVSDGWKTEFGVVTVHNVHLVSDRSEIHATGIIICSIVVFWEARQPPVEYRTRIWKRTERKLRDWVLRLSK